MSLSEIETLVEKSGDVKTCERILQYTKTMMNEANIKMNDTQWLALVSHLSAMVYRSVKHELINSIDKTLFSEISSESIELSGRVCELLENLHEDEKYLLSIHFETAKMNK